MDSQLIYLATKYTDEDPEELEKNYQYACKMAKGLRRYNLKVISPVELFHPIVCAGKAPKDHDMWMSIDLAFQRQCDMTLFLSRHPVGFAASTSRGVLQEMNAACIEHPFLALFVIDVDCLETIADFCKAIFDA